MLVQSSLPSSIEADLSFLSDHGKQDLLCDWISSGESWQKRPTCFEHSRDGEHSSAPVEIDNASNSDSLIHSRTCSKLSSVTTMCASSAPNFVYKRRKLPRKSVTFLSAGATYSRKGKKERKGSDGCLPNICSDNIQKSICSDNIQKSICFDNIQKNIAGATYSRKGKKERKGSDGCLPNICSDNIQKSICSDNIQKSICSDNIKKSICFDNIQKNICSDMPSEPGKRDDNHHSQSKYESVVIALPVVIPQKVYKKRKLCPQKLDVPFTGTTNIKVLKSESNNNGCSGREERGSEALNNTVPKSVLDCSSLNDSCSSSKSNVELGSSSMKTDIDDIGECSSSDILITDLLGGSLSEKEKCISLLKSHGLLERASPVKDSGSIDVGGINGYNYHSCKICGDLENSLKMLICDNCEEAFHVSCCNPKLKKIPLDEWYCQPCSRKKRKLSRETAMLNRKGEVSRCKSRTTKGDLGPISFMLKDTESYTTGVRIGKAFQANVPDWSGQISIDVDCIGEPMEMDHTDSGSLYGWNAKKFSAPSSIGNWLQCQEVLDNDIGGDTICGKWRRAPLFEVQTDDWDCSCSVLWDPVHSDCAVPQELDTDQVQMHLKYIEMLRPRLAAKKQKLTRSKSDVEDFRSVTSKEGDS